MPYCRGKIHGIPRFSTSPSSDCSTGSPGKGTDPHPSEEVPALWSAPKESADRGGSLPGVVFRCVGWEPHLRSPRGGRHSEIQRSYPTAPALCARDVSRIPCAGMQEVWEGDISGSSTLGGLEVELPQETSAVTASASFRALSLAHHHLKPGSLAHAQAHSNKWPLPAGRAVGGIRRYPVSPAEPAPLSLARALSPVVPPPLSRPALRRRGKMAAEKQVPAGGGGSSSGGSGGGRGAGGEENKENERPSAGSKANKEFGDSLSLESILQKSGLTRNDYVSIWRAGGGRGGGLRQDLGRRGRRLQFLSLLPFGT